MRLFVVLVAVVVAVLGCRARSVVGTWDAADGKSNLTLGRDGTASGSVSIGPVQAGFNAKYEFDGTVLTLKDVDIPMLSLAPDEAKKIAEQALPSVMDHQVQWRDDQTMVLRGGAFLNGRFNRRPEQAGVPR